MATVVFGAVGTALGGPVGGALGALLGQQVDNAIFKVPTREGPRLNELAVTTSSYGMPIPRTFGRVRVPGTIIWATEIRESSETSGGGKGSPSTTSYSYSASFAVAVASRQVGGIGRVWADGNLLRGAAGDLKVGGTMRVHTGSGDQAPDPLIASAMGPRCPSFRDCAYVVFENLQLGDFGSRIPALTFEVLADGGEVSAAQLLEKLGRPVEDRLPLTGLAGMTDDGGSFASILSTLDSVYPIALDVAGDVLSLAAADAEGRPVHQLPEAAALSGDDDGFAPRNGSTRLRASGEEPVPTALRHYDASRDYQPGVQRAGGRSETGRPQTIELPATIAAEDARGLIAAAADRARQSRERVSWRLAELDPAIGPGALVTLPGRRGTWRVDGWEWVGSGVELALIRQAARTPFAATPADPGIFRPIEDLAALPTILQAFEVPPATLPTGASRRVTVAAGAAGASWPGASLYNVVAGSLVPVGGIGPRQSVLGVLAADLPPSPSLLLEPQATLEIELANAGKTLESATPEQLMLGANTLRVGGEVLQFVHAARTEGSVWRLTGLLRGRRGTEGAALAGATMGTEAALLDSGIVEIGDDVLPSWSSELAALGLGDAQPVLAPIAHRSASNAPPAPVHPRIANTGNRLVSLSWTRRARGGWSWPDAVEIPLVEDREAYRVGIGDIDAPLLFWDVDAPRLDIPTDQWAGFRTDYAGLALWVRQLGTLGQSPATLLTLFA